MSSLHMQRFAHSVLNPKYSRETAIHTVDRPGQNTNSLRNSNINLGTAGAGYVDEYEENYKWPTGQEPVKAEDGQRLRDAHFTFGNERLDYAKTSTMVDPSKVGGTRSKLDQETLKDLQQAHFTLGDDKTDYDSATSTAHNIPGNDFSAYQRSPTTTKKGSGKGKMSNVHIGTSVGVDPEHFLSTCSQNFVKHDGVPTSTLSPGALADLRATHYSLGNEKGDYATSNNLTAGLHMGERAKLVASAELQQSHFSLGSDQLDYKSEYKGTTNAQAGLPDLSGHVSGAGGPGGSTGTAKSARQSSVRFGDEATDYTTRVTSTYAGRQGSNDVNAESKATKAALQASHFKLGSDPSLYRRSNLMQDPRHAKLQTCSLDTDAVNNLRKSHFKTGDDVVDFTTSTGDAQAFSSDYSLFKRGEEAAQKNNNSHFEFTGQDHVPTSTVQDAYQYDPDKLDASGLSRGKRSYKSNLNLGHEIGDYKTTFAMPDTIEFMAQTKAAEKDQEPCNTVDLRTTNYDLGNDPTDYNTQYRATHQSYRFRTQ